MRIILVCLIMLTAHLVCSQPVHNDPPEYTGQGKLIIVRIIPGDKTAKLFLLGKKTAEVNLKKEAKLLSVFLNSSGSTEELRVNNRGDYYEVNNLPRSTIPYVLSIRANVNGETENIKVQVRDLP